MAKQYKHLFDQVTSFENLWAAFHRAAKGKRSQPEVAEFELWADIGLPRLRSKLLAGTWLPGGYRSFTINDPKRRVVSAAPFADRVVHHALVQVMEPLFEATFIADSYANRKGKGVHTALDKAQGWVRGYRYMLPCDLKQFFPSVDHSVLLELLARKVACPATLDLCRKLLAGGDGLLEGEYHMVFFAGDDLFAAQRPRGLPIGNLTSQFWANVLLNALDQFVKRELRCHAYLRYVDDFVLFSDSKSELWGWKGQIVDKLAALRLVMHYRSACVAPTVNGLPFLGFRLFADQRRLKTRNAWAFSHRLRHMQRAVAAGAMDAEAVRERVRGWVAHAQHADTWRLRETLFNRASVQMPLQVGVSPPQSGDAGIPAFLQAA